MRTSTIKKYRYGMILKSIGKLSKQKEGGRFSENAFDDVRQ